MQRLCRGILIVFEGIDGAGKTTQVHLLLQALRQAGYDVLASREPTEGMWGQKIRHLTSQGRQGVAPETELEWFLEDRREHVARYIRPALDRGQVVLLDRYYFSTMAYQGALGLEPQTIQALNEAFAPPPDLLFILDLEPIRGWQRIQQRGASDHFERLEYLDRVATLFAAMQFPYLRRIPADTVPATVQSRIQEDVWRLLQQQTLCDDSTGRKDVLS